MPNLYIEIIGDADSFQRALRKASGETQTFGSKLSSLGKTAGLAAGAAGIAGLTYAVHAGVTEWMQHQQVAAQTEAVLKSTGGAANVTAKQVDALAESLMKKSGVDDEAIASGENLLLTFTNIHNEAGRGNDIFNQATAAMLDMSVALGQDMKSSAIQLGKALNDPVKGMTALRRVGVSFTDAQKEQVKALVESGNVMGAQKVILGELTKEFGGSAEAAGNTLPGKLDILKERFNNLAGEGVQKAIDKFYEMQPTLQTLADGFMRVLPTLQAMGGYLFTALVTPLKVITDLIRGDWQAAWDDLKAPVEAAINVITTIFGGLAGTIAGYAVSAFDAAVGFAAGILSGIRSGITGTAQAVWSEITQAVSAVVNSVGGAISAAVSFGAGILSGMRSGITGFAEWVWGRITAAVGYVTGAVGAALSAATAFGAGILSGMQAGISGFANYVLGRVTDAIQWLISKAGAALSAAIAFGKSIFDGVKAGIGAILEIVSGPLQGAIDWIVGAAGRAYDAAKTLGAAIYNGIKAGLGPIIAFIDGVKAAIDKVTSAAGAVGDAAGAVGGVVGSVGGAIGGVIPGHGSSFRMPSDAALSAAANNNGMVVNVNVPVQGALLGTSTQEVAETIRNEFVSMFNANGSLGFTPT